MGMEVKGSGGSFFSDVLGSMEQLFSQVQCGVALLDDRLRYLHLNDRMAMIHGKPAGEQIGKSPAEVDPVVGVAVEPILARAVREEQTLVGQEVVVRSAETGEKAFLRLSCYPLKNADGKVTTCGVTLQDVTGQKRREECRARRLMVEALLSDLSTDFINVSISEVDRKIEQGLQRVVEVLRVDRATIWNLAADGKKLFLAHSYALPGVKPPLPEMVGLIPVWMEMIRRGEIFHISDVDDLPPENWREREYCRDAGGIKSILFIPAIVGGTPVGTVTFTSYQRTVEWPDELVHRLRLLWEIFANALERKRADQKIQTALAEIEQLKDRLEVENIYLRDQINIEYKHDDIVGQSGGIKKVLSQVMQVAPTDSTVLILGETGTGKELIARAIHNLSGRRTRSMIKVNCAALPAALIEAELFGYEKGAYTGAVSTQIGRFEAANGSTIFLDEIGELPLELQSKLLRVLQEGQFERLGSPRPVVVDVRVIAATNRDLARAVREGRFREDLYYRLNVFPVSVPPLRERREDIPLLVWSMVEEFGKSFGRTIERISKKNMEAMERYHWPGNIRELRNLVERAMIVATGETLVVEVPDTSAAVSSAPLTIEGVERMHIISVLEKTGWRIRGRNGAAEILGLKPTTLNSRMKKLGIRRAGGFHDDKTVLRLEAV